MIKDIFFNNLSQGLQFGSRWVLNVTLIVILDIETFAVFSFVYSLSNILLSLLPFGSPVFLIAQVDGTKKGIKTLLESIIVATTLFTLVISLYIGLTPFLSYIKGWSFSGYGIILSYLLSLNLMVFSYFKGLGNFKKELYAYIIFSSLLLLFTAYAFFVLNTIINVSYIFLVLIVLNIIVLLYAILSSELKSGFIEHIRNFKNSTFNFKNMFQCRLYFGLQEIVTAIYSQAGLLVLFYILNEQIYGYYRALFVVVAPVFMITTAISQVVLKHLKTSNDKMKIFRKIQRYTLLLGVLLCIVILLFRSSVLSFIQIEETSITKIAFYIIIVITLLRFIFANYEMLLVDLDKQRQRFLVQLIAAFVSLTSIFLLLPRYGLVGAVSTNMLSYLVVSVGLIWISEKYLKAAKRSNDHSSETKF